MIKLTLRGGYPEYVGLSYEAASREAARLLQKGIKGSWFFSLERLVQLREIMQRHICSGAVAADARRPPPDRPV